MFLLDQVLMPYKNNCRYLKRAHLEDNRTAFGEFSISESYYIADTGHLNSVEINICFNQLSYYLIAGCIQHKLLAEFSDWDIDNYLNHQLSDCMLARFSSLFRKAMRTDKFYGSIHLQKISIKHKKIFISAILSFYDENGGSAEGKALIVITTEISIC